MNSNLIRFAEDVIFDGDPATINSNSNSNSSANSDDGNSYNYSNNNNNNNNNNNRRTRGNSNSPMHTANSNSSIPSDKYSLNDVPSSQDSIVYFDADGMAELKRLHPSHRSAPSVHSAHSGHSGRSHHSHHSHHSHSHHSDRSRGGRAPPDAEPGQQLNLQPGGPGRRAGPGRIDCDSISVAHEPGSQQPLHMPVKIAAVAPAAGNMENDNNQDDDDTQSICVQPGSGNDDIAPPACYADPNDIGNLFTGTQRSPSPSNNNMNVNNYNNNNNNNNNPHHDINHIVVDPNHNMNNNPNNNGNNRNLNHDRNDNMNNLNNMNNNDNNVNNNNGMNGNAGDEMDTCINELESLGYPRRIINHWKVRFYEFNTQEIVRNFVEDSFCHEFAVMGRCSFGDGRSVRCNHDHLYNLVHMSSIQPNRDERHFKHAMNLCEYLISIQKYSYQLSRLFYYSAKLLVNYIGDNHNNNNLTQFERRNNLHKAKELYSKAVQIGFGTFNTRIFNDYAILLSNDLFRSNRLAAFNFQRALERSSIKTDIDVQFNYGYFLFTKLNDTAQSIGYLQRACELTARNQRIHSRSYRKAFYYYWAGMALYKLEQYNEGKERLIEALNVNDEIMHHYGYIRGDNNNNVIDENTHNIYQIGVLTDEQCDEITTILGEIDNRNVAVQLQQQERQQQNISPGRGSGRGRGPPSAVSAESDRVDHRGCVLYYANNSSCFFFFCFVCCQSCCNMIVTRDCFAIVEQNK